MEHFYQDVEGGGFGPGDHGFYHKIIKAMPDKFRAVEVGSFKGNSAASFIVEAINSGKNFEFTCVDTWRGSPGEHAHDNDPDVQQGRLFEVFTKNLEPVADFYNVVVGDSAESASNFEDASLDFVFIDASHDYESVIKDIDAWKPKVKPGGILSGHDAMHPPIILALATVFGNDYEILAMSSCWMHRIK